MEKNKERLNFLQYIKQGFKELMDTINGKNSQPLDIDSTDEISNEVREILLKSLEEGEARAIIFQKQIDEDGTDKNKRINKKSYTNNYNTEQTPDDIIDYLVQDSNNRNDGEQR